MTLTTQDKLELTELIARYKQYTGFYNHLELTRMIELLLKEHDSTIGDKTN